MPSAGHSSSSHSSGLLRGGYLRRSRGAARSRLSGMLILASRPSSCSAHSHTCRLTQPSRQVLLQNDQRSSFGHVFCCRASPANIAHRLPVNNFFHCILPPAWNAPAGSIQTDSLKHNIHSGTAHLDVPRTFVRSRASCMRFGGKHEYDMVSCVWLTGMTAHQCCTLTCGSLYRLSLL